MQKEKCELAKMNTKLFCMVLGPELLAQNLVFLEVLAEGVKYFVSAPINKCSVFEFFENNKFFTTHSILTLNRNQGNATGFGVQSMKPRLVMRSEESLPQNPMISYPSGISWACFRSPWFSFSHFATSCPLDSRNVMPQTRLSALLILTEIFLIVFEGSTSLVQSLLFWPLLWYERLQTPFVKYIFSLVRELSPIISTFCNLIFRSTGNVFRSS